MALHDYDITHLEQANHEVEMAAYAVAGAADLHLQGRAAPGQLAMRLDIYKRARDRQRAELHRMFEATVGAGS